MSAEKDMVRKSEWPMITVSEALSLVVEQTRRTRPVEVDAHLACGMVAAKDVHAKHPYPTFRASIMDGYAVNGPLVAGKFPIQKRVHAGSANEDTLLGGNVAYITTGAKVPEGANAVIKVEDTSYVSEDEVTINVSCTEGANIRQIGSDIAVGDVLLKEGQFISPADVGLLATSGVDKVLCYPVPVVGVMSTGDELVNASGGAVPTGSQIRDCNRPMLLAAFKRDGYGTRDLGIVQDVVADLKKALRDAAQICDVIVTSGGVSMGDADHVKRILAELGAIHFGRMNMKPGKPTTFATIGDSTRSASVFALPGNPVSCLVTKTLLVDPALKIRRGFTPHRAMPAQAEVRLHDTLPLDMERAEYHRVYLSAVSDDIVPVANSTGNQRSSRLLSMQGCDALLCLPKGSDSQSEVPAGQKVPALLLNCGYPGASSGLPLPPPNRSVFPEAAAMKDPGASDVAPPLPGPSSSSSASMSSKLSSSMPVRTMNVGVLTISDRASAGTYKDESGPLLRKLITEMDFSPHEKKMAAKGLVTKSLEARCIEANTDLVADDENAISKAVQALSTRCNLVLTTGGTGFGKRDVTPEAVKPLFDREAPGVAQALLAAGLKHTPLAVLARPVVGVRGNTLIVTLPGSMKAISENIEALSPLLPRIMELLMDGNDEAAH